MKLHTSCTWRFRSSATLKFTTNFLCVEFRWPGGSPVCRDRKKKHQRELDNPAIAPAWRTSGLIEKESISNWSLNLWYTFQWFHFLLEKFWKNKNYLLTTLNKYIYIYTICFLPFPASKMAAQGTSLHPSLTRPQLWRAARRDVFLAHEWPVNGRTWFQRFQHALKIQLTKLRTNYTTTYI